MLKPLCKVFVPVALLVSALLGCNFANFQNRQDGRNAQRTRTADGWTTHQDPSGFALDIPAGWTVTSDSGRVTAAGPNAERVTIYPLRVEDQLDADGAQRLLVDISSKFWPKQLWNMPKGGWGFGPNGVRAVGMDDSAVRQTTALWWANTPQGASCFFYEVESEPARFEADASTFTRILQSFRVTPAAEGRENVRGSASDQTARVQFQRWTDPTEGAFSLEAPAGWQVSGGIKRDGATSRTSEWTIQSPDGEVNIRSGDASLPPAYVEPVASQFGPQYTEGQKYSTTNWVVMRFVPAAEFASGYAQREAADFCNNLRWLERKDRQDYVQQMGQRGLLQPNMQYTAAEVSFTCQGEGQPFIGYLFVLNYATPPSYVGRMWHVHTLYGFIARAERAREADAVLSHAISTFEVNPQWYGAERQAETQTAEQFRQFREYSTQLQQQTQAERWASWDRIAEQRGDILTGQTRVVDPESGRAYKVQSGSNYYWVDPNREVIAGTDQPYRPTWDFRQMIETYK